MRAGANAVSGQGFQSTFFKSGKGPFWTFSAFPRRSRPGKQESTKLVERDQQRGELLPT